MWWYGSLRCADSFECRCMRFRTYDFLLLFGNIRMQAKAAASYGFLSSQAPINQPGSRKYIGT